MFSYVEFKNYRVLRDVNLSLTPCTLLLGPNGSGKSTLLRGLKWISEVRTPSYVGLQESDKSLGIPKAAAIELVAVWNNKVRFVFNQGRTPLDGTYIGSIDDPEAQLENPVNRAIQEMKQLRVFSLDPRRIDQPVQLIPGAEIMPDGMNLSVVLTQLQDQYPERFDALNEDLGSWLPEFDRILFDTPAPGMRAFSLRTVRGKYPIQAFDLSFGTLLALCLLTLSHIPNPPSVVCLEEPDQLIHPRMLRRVHDAMIRLSNPQQFGDNRQPVQVIATTHSPYLLDLFRDHPQDVVLAEKLSNGSKFHRLTDMPHYQDILNNTSLGDAWYTSILGGVPITI